jgi:ABC-type uncharacterized transport system YnjBCD ATPase subunit
MCAIIVCRQEKKLQASEEAMADRVEARNVSMYPVQWAAVDQLAKDGAYGGTSEALRQVVREWLMFKRSQLALPMEPVVMDVQNSGEGSR